MEKKNKKKKKIKMIEISFIRGKLNTRRRAARSDGPRDEKRSERSCECD